MSWLNLGFTAGSRLGYQTGDGTGLVVDWDTISPNLSTEGAWGTLLRNPNYTGPLLRVEDNANPGTTQDIFPNVYGLLDFAAPYGIDTRVVTLYDQYGSSDMFATLSDNIEIYRDVLEYSSWIMVFNGSGGLTSTVTTSSSPGWAASAPVWGLGHIRRTDSGLRPFWGIQANTNNMKVGVWSDLNDLSWRINSSTLSDWLNTDWDNNADDVRDIFRTAIGDMSAGSPATAYFHNVNAGTKTYTHPITYDAGKPINIGTGLVSNPLIGDVTELVVFESSAAADLSEIGAIHLALEQIFFFEPQPILFSREARTQAILGAGPAGTSYMKAQRSQAILGGSPDTSVKGHQCSVIVIP